MPSAERKPPKAWTDQHSVVVVGATGVVGGKLLSVLEERSFPVANLRALAGPSSLGKRISFRGESIEVEAVRPEAFDGARFVFFAATGELSRELAPEAVRRGAFVIDKSSTWRLDPEVPLVVPEINGSLLTQETKLIACPNCTTIGLVMALEPIRRAAGLVRVTATTLQAASGVGREGPLELASQEASLAAGLPVESAVFPGQLARNVLPQCGDVEPDGTTSEERKLLQETRRILSMERLSLMATCTRVPVAVGHSIALTLETEQPLSVEEAGHALEAFPGVELVDQPTAQDVTGSDAVLVGRLRRPPGETSERLLQLWVVIDNLRKGAATNAAQIAEHLLKA